MGHTLYRDEPDYASGREVLNRLLETAFERGEITKEEYDNARAVTDGSLVAEQWKGDE